MTYLATSCLFQCITEILIYYRMKQMVNDYGENVDLGPSSRKTIRSDNIEVEAVDISTGVELVMAEALVDQSDLVFKPDKDSHVGTLYDTIYILHKFLIGFSLMTALYL